MATDRQAVIWTRLGGTPRRMARIVITDRECRFTYDPDYPASGLPGLGLLYPPARVAGHTLVWQRTAWFDLFPPLQAHVPPEAEGGFQRRLILRYLERRGIHPAPGFDTDWAILLVAGHGGIGHLDVFADDEAAAQWYAAGRDSELFPIGERIGFSLKRFLTWLDEDAEGLLEALGPTPSVGGAIPKLLLSIPKDGWDGRVGLPTRGPAPDRLDVVLKFEKGTYPGIVALEALALEVHAEAGFDVPRHWRCEVGGLPSLAIERYDRDADNQPIFTESVYAVLAAGDRRITHHYSASYDAIGHAIDVSPEPLVSAPRAAKEHLLRRLLLAFATGNGDLHLENLSFIQHGDQRGFSPVYDPTPMRAWRRHDLLAAMPFDGYGDFDEHGQPIGFAEALVNLSRHLGFRRPQLNAIIDDTLAATREYPERIMALTDVPEANREHLSRISAEIRQRLKRLLG